MDDWRKVIRSYEYGFQEVFIFLHHNLILSLRDHHRVSDVCLSITPHTEAVSPTSARAQESRVPRGQQTAATLRNTTCVCVYLHVFVCHGVSVRVVRWERGMLGENPENWRRAHIAPSAVLTTINAVFSSSALTHWSLKRIPNTHLHRGGES